MKGWAGLARQEGTEKELMEHQLGTSHGLTTSFLFFDFRRKDHLYSISEELRQRVLRPGITNSDMDQAANANKGVG